MNLTLNIMRLLKGSGICLLAIAMFASSCRQKKELAKNSGKDEVKHGNNSSFKESLGISDREIRENKLYKFVNDWYGTAYKYGGCTKAGVDCSCFTSNLYESVYGRKVARIAGDIQKECDKVNVEKLREGDLVFFIINGKNISHVGVYLKENKFVHASTSKGVIISDLNETYYKKYFHSAGRLKHSS